MRLGRFFFGDPAHCFEIDVPWLSSVREIIRKDSKNLSRFTFETIGGWIIGRSQYEDGGTLVSRALKSQKLWLSLTYLGLILLMARTYA